MMSTWIFEILIRYCHVDSQRRRFPTHVPTGRPDDEGGVGGVEPSRTQMWFKPKYVLLSSNWFFGVNDNGPYSNHVDVVLSYPCTTIYCMSTPNMVSKLVFWNSSLSWVGLLHAFGVLNIDMGWHKNNQRWYAANDTNINRLFSPNK